MSAALFGTWLSYGTCSWQRDACANSYRGFMSLICCSSVSMLRW